MKAFSLPALWLCCLLGLTVACEPSPHNTWIQEASHIKVFAYTQSPSQPVLILKEAEEIEAMRQAIDFTDAELPLCEPEGELRIFRPDGDSLVVKWSAREDCPVASYTVDSISYRKRLTRGGIMLLRMVGAGS